MLAVLEVVAVSASLVSPAGRDLGDVLRLSGASARVVGSRRLGFVADLGFPVFRSQSGSAAEGGGPCSVIRSFFVVLALHLFLTFRIRRRVGV